jgi:hypothetical protein
MNKNLLIKILRALLRICIKLLICSLAIVLLILPNEKIQKQIKEREKWENDYDEYTADITKRKFLY